MNMKTACFTFDHINNAIVGSKSAIKRASLPDSDEYKILKKMMKEQPSYAVAEKIIKKKAAHKKTYGGLTLDKMKEFIETQPNTEKNLVRFEKAKKEAKARNATYPLTKQWFLKEFPAYKSEIVIADEESEKVIEAEKTNIAELPADIDRLGKKSA